MKKLFLILILALGTSMTISSCADEDIKPAAASDNGGGHASEPIRAD